MVGIVLPAVTRPWLPRVRLLRAQHWRLSGCVTDLQVVRLEQELLIACSVPTDRRPILVLPLARFLVQPSLQTTIGAAREAWVFKTVMPAEWPVVVFETACLVLMVRQPILGLLMAPFLVQPSLRTTIGEAREASVFKTALLED